jgi:acid stress-induced BolA-like protein IbaG/YrbA
MNQAIEQAVVAEIPGAEVEVELDGNRAVITVVSEVFAELNRVQKQQKVYGCINGFIADGRLHAVTIRALTPEQAGG